MSDVEMAVHMCGARGDSSLAFKHTSSLSLACCSVPSSRPRPRRRAFHMRNQEGNGKLGLVEECRIGILPVCVPRPLRSIVPKQRQRHATRPKTNKSFRITVLKDWAVYELKHSQMMQRVVDNLFGREAALLLQPRFHVHHLWVDGAQVGDVGLVSIRREPTDHMAELSNHVGQD